MSQRTCRHLFILPADRWDSLRCGASLRAFVRARGVMGGDD
jgi:hypothetical protein